MRERRQSGNDSGGGGGGGMEDPLLPRGASACSNSPASAYSPPPAGEFPSRPWWMGGDGETGGGEEAGIADDVDVDDDGRDGDSEVEAAAAASAGMGRATRGRDGGDPSNVLLPPPMPLYPPPPSPSSEAPFATNAARRRRRRPSSPVASSSESDRTAPTTMHPPSSSSSYVDDSAAVGGLNFPRRRRWRCAAEGGGGGELVSGCHRILDRSGRFHQSRGRWAISTSGRVDDGEAEAASSGAASSAAEAEGRAAGGYDDDGSDDGSGNRRSAGGGGGGGRRRHRGHGRGHGRRSILNSVRTHPRSARSMVRGGQCSPRRCWDDWFHTLAHTPTAYLMMIMFLCYTLTIFWFAFLYWFVSREFQPDELIPTAAASASASASRNGRIDRRTETDGSFCGMDITTPTEALYFSLSTMTTIGYGVSDYYFGDCLTPFVLVLLQVFTAITFDAVAIGLLFTRMSRGQKRGRTIIFSDRSVVLRVRGRLYWMCRVGELRRKHHIVDARVRAYCVRHERHPDPWHGWDGGGGGGGGDRDELGGPAAVPDLVGRPPAPIDTTYYQTRPLRLVAPDDEIGSNVLMSLPGAIVHRLDGDGRGRSPLVPPSPVWYDGDGRGHLWPPPPSPPASAVGGAEAEAEAAAQEEIDGDAGQRPEEEGGNDSDGGGGDGDVDGECGSVDGRERGDAAGTGDATTDTDVGALTKTPRASNRSLKLDVSPAAEDNSPAAAVVAADEHSSSSAAAAKTAAMGASAIAGGILGTLLAGPIVAGVAGVAAATAAGGAMRGGGGGGEGGGGSGGESKEEDDEGAKCGGGGGTSGGGGNGKGGAGGGSDGGGGVRDAEEAGPSPANGYGNFDGIDEGDEEEEAVGLLGRSGNDDIDRGHRRRRQSPSHPPLSPDQSTILSFLSDRDAELVILIEGIDEMTGGAVQAKHSYRWDDVAWNGTFAPCVFPSYSLGGGGGASSGEGGDVEEGGGRRAARRRGPACVVDFERFHEIVPAPEDCASCPFVPDWA